MYVDKEETDSTWIICRRYSGYYVGSVFLKVRKDFTKLCIVNVKQKITTSFLLMIRQQRYPQSNWLWIFNREGFQAVECDIHETAKDKKGKRRFVIMHDQTLNRMCGLSGKNVYQKKLTYQKIRSKYHIKTGNNIESYTKKQLRIPSLEEYLSICKRYHINVSIDKNILSDDMIQLFETNNIKINIWTINNKDQLYNFTNKGIKIVTSDDVLWKE